MAKLYDILNLIAYQEKKTVSLSFVGLILYENFVCSGRYRSSLFQIQEML